MRAFIGLIMETDGGGAVALALVAAVMLVAAIVLLRSVHMPADAVENEYEDTVYDYPPGCPYEVGPIR